MHRCVVDLRNVRRSGIDFVHLRHSFRYQEVTRDSRLEDCRRQQQIAAHGSIIYEETLFARTKEQTRECCANSLPRDYHNR
jgi:hypothetical protein